MLKTVTLPDVGEIYNNKLFHDYYEPSQLSTPSGGLGKMFRATAMNMGKNYMQVLQQLVHFSSTQTFCLLHGHLYM